MTAQESRKLAEDANKNYPEEYISSIIGRINLKAKSGGLKIRPEIDERVKDHTIFIKEYLEELGYTVEIVLNDHTHIFLNTFKISW